MLLQWSLMHHKWRKQLAMMLYQRDSLDRASIFFATSQEEADDLRALGIHQAIALVPNGVDVPGVHAPVIFAGANRRTALFLSRLHPKKGLHDLLRAWAKLKPKDWILVVAGPDEGGYQTEMMTLSNSLGISDVTKFIGPVSDDEKWPLYCACELFVLPTYSENFGMAIGEAMACGCAVLTTTGAPWKSLIDENAGWWVPPGEEGIAPALEAALACSESKLAAMGARGKAFVERELTWNIAAEKTIAAYRWLLSGGVRPNHVQA
jgi:glycosyltransferase involved in cell wall biosynthesis